jgi:8-oxo-dGTP diphosphatase
MTQMNNKQLQVTCAIIERDGLVLAAQRSASMSLPLKWEFPGGKIDPGESPEECLQRELVEELGLQILPVRRLPSHTHHYPTFSVTLYPFICVITAGEITLHEHAAITWLSPERLGELDWAEADYPVITGYQALVRGVAGR